MNYSPSDMVTQLAGGIGVIMPWVGVFVTAALMLWSIFYGLRAAFRLFKEIFEEGKHNRADRIAGQEAYNDALDAEHAQWMAEFDHGGASDSERSEAEFRNETGEYHGDLPFDFGPAEYSTGDVSDAKWNAMNDDEKDTELARQAALGNRW